jgi:hypothetical protein
MVLTVRGTVLLNRAGERPGQIGMMDFLRDGDGVTVGKAGEALLIILADGHRERLQPGRRVAVRTKGCSPAAAVVRLPGDNVSAQNLDRLRELARSGRGSGIVLRDPDLGEPKKGTPLNRDLTPSAGAVVLTARPRLAWAAVPGMRGYAIEVSRKEGARRPLWRVTTSALYLEYPVHQKPLGHGTTYRWRVTKWPAGEDDRVVVDSTFEVAGKEVIQELRKLRPPPGADPAELVLAAATFEAHRVYDRALPLYERLGRRLPNEPNFQRALARLYARAGRPAQAQAAREWASELEARRHANSK